MNVTLNAALKMSLVNWDLMEREKGMEHGWKIVKVLPNETAL